MGNLHNTIKVKNYSDVVEEYDAVAAITPGMLIELTSAGEVQAHSNAGQNVLPMFAAEDELQGKGIDDDYAADDKVQCWIPGRGCIVYAILADGNDVNPGDFLESNGAGLLQKYTADVDSYESNVAGSFTVYSNQIVGVALDDIDISDSSGAESSGERGYDKRIRVRII